MNSPIPIIKITSILLCLFLAMALTSCDGENSPSDSGDADSTSDPGLTGILPVPDSLDGPGPFEVNDQRNTGPNNQYRVFSPKNLGQNGIKHPIMVFPAGGMAIQSYKGLLDHVASHGFVVIAFLPTLVSDLTTGLEWLVAENNREESLFFGKLDTGRITAMGQSFGALMAFQLAADPRMITTIHLSGGTMEPHKPIENLHAPALFLCGDDPEKLDGGGMAVGDMAYANCEADFDIATTPVFYAVVENGSHVSVIDKLMGAGFGTDQNDPQRKLFYKAIAGWLRWQIADDQSLEEMFVGDDCDLCAPDSGYVVKQKNLN